MDHCPGDVIEVTSEEITRLLQFHTQTTEDQQRRIEELEKKLAEHENTISSLRIMEGKRMKEIFEARKMAFKNEELLAKHEETISSLRAKEKECSQEVADAHKMATQIVQAMHSGQANWLIDEALGGTTGGTNEPTDCTRWRWSRNLHISVGLKMVGSIDEGLWRRVCLTIFKSDLDWAWKMRRSLSKWEDLVRDSEFQPFKMAPVGNSSLKREIDHQDKQLVALKKEFGDVLYNSVTTALIEMEECNPTGRYPILVVWDFVNSKKASLKQVIAYFGTALNALASTGSPRKRLRS